MSGRRFVERLRGGGQILSIGIETPFHRRQACRKQIAQKITLAVLVFKG